MASNIRADIYFFLQFIFFSIPLNTASLLFNSSLKNVYNQLVHFDRLLCFCHFQPPFSVGHILIALKLLTFCANAAAEPIRMVCSRCRLPCAMPYPFGSVDMHIHCLITSVKAPIKYNSPPNCWFCVNKYVPKGFMSAFLLPTLGYR